MSGINNLDQIVNAEDPTRAIPVLTARESWNALDQDFYKYQDNFNQLNIDYLKQNRLYFWVGIGDC